jgi:hypothetical protein
LSPLRRAGLVAFCTHLLAGISMALILENGLETTPDIQDRFAFLVNHRALWTAGWLSWTAAAISILYFYLTFASVHRVRSRLPVFLTVIAIGPDLAAQAIEIGVLPSLAAEAFSKIAAPELFLTLHRVAVMLSGYLANGLYSVSAASLAWMARYAYPAWVSAMGVAVGVFGLTLSVAALLDSATGMFWTNVLLVPALLVWLAAVAIIPVAQRRVDDRRRR